MHGLNKRRQWNNDKVTSAFQENHEYNQWARNERKRQEEKREKARENKYQLYMFPVGTHTKPHYNMP